MTELFYLLLKMLFFYNSVYLRGWTKSIYYHMDTDCLVVARTNKDWTPVIIGVVATVLILSLAIGGYFAFSHIHIITAKFR